MGYYADGSGSIVFKRGLSPDEVEKVYSALETVFESLDVTERNAKNVTEFSFWTNDKYHEDVVTDVLNEVAEVADIQDGEVDYIGEDESFWRYIFYRDKSNKGQWKYQIGRIVWPEL